MKTGMVMHLDTYLLSSSKVVKHGIWRVVFEN